MQSEQLFRSFTPVFRHYGVVSTYLQKTGAAHYQFHVNDQKTKNSLKNTSFAFMIHPVTRFYDPMGFIVCVI